MHVLVLKLVTPNSSYGFLNFIINLLKYLRCSVSQLSGSTELKFSSVTRSQAGVYRVVIQSGVGHGVFGIADTREEVSFQVDVIGKQ